MTTEEIILVCVSRIRNIMHRETGRRLNYYGLTTTQFSVLEALYSNGDLSVGEIQTKILGTPGNIPGVINNLVRLGYVSKDTDRNDKRILRVSMTEAGRDLMTKIYPNPHQKWLEEILSALSENERKDFAKVLLKTYHAIADDKDKLVD